MKRKIGKWTLRLTATGLLLFALLIGIILNPALLYANKTSVDNDTVYHNAPLDKDFFSRLDEARHLVK